MDRTKKWKALQEYVRIRAFRTELDDIISIVYAETASKARHITRISALDVCYTNVEYADIKVLRAKEYDKATLLGGGTPTIEHCYSMVYLRLEDM